MKPYVRYMPIWEAKRGKLVDAFEVYQTDHLKLADILGIKRSPARGIVVTYCLSGS